MKPSETEPAPARRRPGRPRAFDEDEVLDAALDAFWRRGFEATSMADLIHATGLHKGSLGATRVRRVARSSMEAVLA